MQLQFTQRQRIRYKDLANLPEWQRAQLVRLAMPVYGRALATAEEVLEQTYEGECVLWRVVAADDPATILYYCWVMDSDSGAVFVGETTQAAGVEMTQWYFDVSGDWVGTAAERKALEKLAEAFQAAFEAADAP